MRGTALSAPRNDWYELPGLLNLRLADFDADDKILASMSSALEFTDKDTRDRYLLGLKGVIADLRARNVRDFEAVASALSEYRRKFVSGDS